MKVGWGNLLCRQWIGRPCIGPCEVCGGRWASLVVLPVERSFLCRSLSCVRCGRSLEGWGGGGGSLSVLAVERLSCVAPCEG